MKLQESILLQTFLHNDIFFVNILKFRFNGIYLLSCTTTFIMHMKEIMNIFQSEAKD